MKAVPLDENAVTANGDYRPIWQAILESPKDGSPHYLADSRTWSVVQLERVRSAIRGRAYRSNYPFTLHLLRGPFLAWFWMPVPPDKLTPADLLKDAQESLEFRIRMGTLTARAYRRNPTYQERLTKKQEKRAREDFVRQLRNPMADPDEEKRLTGEFGRNGGCLF